MLDVVIATGNAHKVEEVRAVLEPALGGRVRLRGLAELGAFAEPSETGATFEENSALKALAYATTTGLHCLADDSGLEVDALAGRPGVISSHYCTEGRETGLSRGDRDRLNNERVLRELAGVPPARRGARFVCVVTLARPPRGVEPARVLAASRGTFEGRIGEPPRVPAGGGGFGYDPLFLVEAAPYSLGVTSSELIASEKNRLSHRGAALRGIMRAVNTLATVGAGGGL
ncbi:MAG: non-canonical purine NTP pyrophosphatase [Leptolyngbya sp. PLA1]|nr:non-canonical purine NTP pyrophosphatase [Leptolyngbya sp. PLA1]